MAVLDLGPFLLLVWLCRPERHSVRREYNIIVSNLLVIALADFATLTGVPQGVQVQRDHAKCPSQYDVGWLLLPSYQSLLLTRVI